LGGLKPDIRSQTLTELQARCAEWGQPSYRAGQLLGWIYERRATSWEAMSNLPKGLRQQLAETFDFYSLELARQQGAGDTTKKFLWRLSDGALIESVLIPANPSLYGEASDRQTLCVSTQVGCAYGCKFCASGLDGWKRNLRPEEIVDQVGAVERMLGDGKNRVVNNLVIMGMGEPLANYENLLKALQILNAPWGGGIRAKDHDFDERAGAANKEAGGGAVAV